MNRKSLTAFARVARRLSRCSNDAEDLLQSVLLAAVESGREDLDTVENRRWLMGALRRRAAFDARSAVRRKRREGLGRCQPQPPQLRDQAPSAFVASLPGSLKTTALLILSGHSRAEIKCLLAISDGALRQRIAGIKRRWRVTGEDGFSDFPGLNGNLSFGRMRQALLPCVVQQAAVAGSHDPDGHLFVVRSQNAVPRQHTKTPLSNGVPHVRSP